MKRSGLGLLLLVAALFVAACTPPTEVTDSDDSVRVDQRMAALPDPGFARAYDRRAFDFPNDHGPHPDFATEWWYFTGNLADRNTRRFGYQLTLFRVGLVPGEPDDVSSWRAHQFYMGHLAVSDIASGEHHHSERFSRAAAGLAGTGKQPFSVWLGPWQISGTATGDSLPFPLRLSAASDNFGIDLTVERGARAMVLQGDRGLSQKGAEPGNASYYYSLTRLPTAGTIRVGQATFSVTGNSWFDREWSSSALAADQAGWDWFALHLNDGRDLMYYQMRGTDGNAQRFSSGVLVDVDGTATRLAHDQVNLAVQGEWSSERGTRYPVEWRLQVPDHDLDLSVTAAFDDQEMALTVHYWEGAVDVSGSHSGVGYLELSGYAR
jgi:predicted secreted hydrolase